MEDDKSTAWLDGFGIFMAVFVVVIVTTTNDYSKEQQFLKLNKTAEAEKRVSIVFPILVVAMCEGWKDDRTAQ
ncbi:MAG: hypothetical protein P4M11_09255 [Candidatus Pacebacteria bacterium]|nr:hypothetical protein [Candidatus Paceibacterota bacterium]